MATKKIGIIGGGNVGSALAREIGFDAIDAGPLKNARLLEPFAYLNIQLGYVLQMGTQIGFKLLHGGTNQGHPTTP